MAIQEQFTLSDMIRFKEYALCYKQAQKTFKATADDADPLS